MKQFKIILMCLAGLLWFASCDEETVTYKTFPNPEWAVDLTGQYPVSMSAVVCLPENLSAYETDHDRIAAFIGDECRGVGEPIKVGDQRTYFILIKGHGTEQKRVSFKYYSTKNSYLYTTDAFLSFDVDTRYGSADDPKTLSLNIVNE